ncbi:MAG: Na(+)-translocating NADH-quinone reductase subunit A [Planctomycetaceae bacterium]
MATTRIKQGYDVPISGIPDQKIVLGPTITKVGVLGPDYIGMKPTMAVQVGDQVQAGQLLFDDKKTEGVRYTAPASGTIVAINRGAKRVFQSIEIEVSTAEPVAFAPYPDLTKLTRSQVIETLTQSGLWTAFRTRPYSKVPAPAAKPHSIFVQAIDTNPLAVNPRTVIQEYSADFIHGLQILRHLTDGKVFLCSAPGPSLPGADLPHVTAESFDGPHPAGLPGTHIHLLDPVSANKTVWHVGYQDIIAFGKLLATGQFWTERVIALGGPQVKEPRLIRTNLGASLDELTQGQLLDGENRVVSGSVLNGRASVAPFNYLGRFHTQVSVLCEGRDRELLGWHMPGFNKASVKPVFASALASDGRRLPMTTNTNGSKRAIVPIGSYEAVMPLDILPTFLLKALVTGDTDQAQALGALELDEEDLALCTYVDPGKHEFGPILRKNLTTIEREG